MRCRVCSQHGQALLALNIYDWMSTRVAEGGAGLRPTVFTYTAAMRAALAGNLIDRALKVCSQLSSRSSAYVSEDVYLQGWCGCCGQGFPSHEAIC